MAGGEGSEYRDLPRYLRHRYECLSPGPLLTGLLMDCGWGEWGGGWGLVLSPRPFQDLQGCGLEYLLMVPWASSIAHELWLRRVGAENNPLSGSRNMARNNSY